MASLAVVDSPEPSSDSSARTARGCRWLVLREYMESSSLIFPSVKANRLLLASESCLWAQVLAGLSWGVSDDSPLP
jgi:hypothetical protein